MKDQFTLNSKVFLNSQSLSSLAEIKGNRAFIVSDSIMEKLGYLQKTVEYLNEANITSTVYTGVRPDPDLTLIVEGMRLFLESDSDVLVAIGGGSAIDAAKAILYFAWKGEILKSKPTFIAIPSTSGTGSEVTNFSVVTANGDKTVIVDDFIAPNIAILDSTCIQHVPQSVIADTGMDVLVHALEAYVSKNASDFTDALAEKSIRLIFENLETFYKDPKNQEAREKVLNASCIAGMAFTNAGLGINHSLAHSIGGTFHISHGRSNSLLCTDIIEYNAELTGSASNYAAKRYAQIASLLKLPARTNREGVVNLIAEIERLKKNLSVDGKLRTLVSDEIDFISKLETLAVNSLADSCTVSNPKQPTKEDIISIFKKIY